MIFRLNIFLSLLFAFLLPNNVVASGPVWKVSKNGQHIFVGGTIHLLGKDDYPLPEVFDKAYRQSQILVFEIDPDAAKSPEVQQQFARYAQYKDGRTLKTVLDNETYQALQGFLASKGMGISAFESIKPGMLSVILTVLELKRMGIAGIGVDEFYSQRAVNDTKPRRFLESIDDQLEALLAGEDGNESQRVQQMLTELQRLSIVMQQTKQAWRRGDNVALAEVALNPWMTEFPEVYKALLVDRNQRWVPQIEEMLQTAEVEYILVGALHLAGPDGLLSILSGQGYMIEKLQ